MNMNQNETGGETRNPNAECRTNRSSFVIRHSSFPHAFTLTELLVVITIIAVLAGLITGAAVNALNKAKQASITLEIQQLSSAFEDFKNEYGAYPPNVYPDSLAALSLSNAERKTNANDLLRSLKKAFPRSTEFQVNMSGSTPARNATLVNDNAFPIIENGLSPAESLVFWLQGFSQDLARPISGSDLELIEVDNFTTATTGDTVFAVTMDSRSPRYDFDRGRLRPTRFIQVARQGVASPVRLLLYQYVAPSSEQPFVYFDTSRRTPSQMVVAYPHNPGPATVPGHEFFMGFPNGELVVPLKRLRLGAPNPPNSLANIEYVEQGKFQILHAGIDDIWGNNGWDTVNNLNIGQLNGSAVADLPALLFPTGPFIGDIADTVGNFGTGTLEDAQP